MVGVTLYYSDTGISCTLVSYRIVAAMASSVPPLHWHDSAMTRSLGVLRLRVEAPPGHYSPLCSG